MDRSKSIDSIAKELLELIGTSLGCNWGTFWKVDPISCVLRPTATWANAKGALEKLERDTRSRSLSLSEGTAGHVWRSQKPIWSTNLTIDMCIPRSLDAQSAGFTAGIWFPIKTDKAVYGVLEFLGMNIPAGSETQLAELERFGVQLGLEIEGQEKQDLNGPFHEIGHAEEI